MKTFVKKASLGLALGVTAVAMTAAPAQAQRWHHYRHHGGDTAGAAILGGIIGLGVGAAIASSDHDSYRDRYYGNGYYGNGYGNGYYGNGYYPQSGYYDDRYDYRPTCWTQWRWDPYYGRNVRVRVCN